jgi:hypothetical protein
VKLDGTRVELFQKPYGTPWNSMVYALEHSFDRASVVPEKKLREEALRYGYGSVKPEDVERWSGDDNLWEGLPKRFWRFGNFGNCRKTAGNLSQNRLEQSEILYTDVSPKRCLVS